MLTQLKNGYDNLFFKNGELFKELIKLIDTDIKSEDYQLYEQLDILKLYIINMKNESSIYQLIRPMNVILMEAIYYLMILKILNMFIVLGYQARFLLIRRWQIEILKFLCMIILLINYL